MKLIKTQFNPASISRFKKERYLLNFSEDDFRDSVVRPLMMKQGMKDGRDLCGPAEEGKDTIFIHVDPLSYQNIYAIQTKIGNINLASKASQNLTQAITQLRTALQTSIPLLKTKTKEFPSKVILCASGKINSAARKHIVEEIPDPRIQFLDADDLVPAIDEHLPELWFGVEVNKYPYLASLVDALSGVPTRMGSATTVDIDPFTCPATADDFVPLKLNRITLSPTRRKGTVVQEPKFEEFTVTRLAGRRERRILIVGGAGSGKSTSLRRLVAVIAQNSMKAQTKATVPIVLRAVDILRTTVSFVELLASSTAAISSKRVPAFDYEDLSNGRIVLCVDALDEVPTIKERQSIVDLLAGFSAEYPHCQIILTTRDYVWINDLQGIEEYERFRISPIDWKQTTQIVKRIQKGQALPEKQTKELLRRLQDVHGLQLNPLLVTVFVASSDYQRTDIPANITELFKKFTEMMLGRWDLTKGFAQQYHAPLKDFLLRLVAVKMHRERVTAISLEELKMILTQELLRRGKESDIGLLLDEIVNRSGLFRVLGPQQVEFSHFLLQEFFAGRGLSEQDVSGLLTDDWWQRAIVFYFGENPENHSLLEQTAGQLGQLHSSDLAQGVITLGLALQACYLFTIDKKSELFVEVVDALGRASHEFFGPNAPALDRPLIVFVISYLLGRDAVSCDILRLNAETVSTLLKSRAIEDYREYVEYWQIVGLLECGCLDEAIHRIRSFHPKDERLLLTLYLGAHLQVHLRVSSKAERKKAEEICGYLGPKISHLRQEILREFKTELLEMRQGKIAALPNAEPGKPDARSRDG